jgi:hypothetical protein
MYIDGLLQTNTIGYLRWTMATSLLKTLAGKNQTSVTKEAKRLNGTSQTPEGPRKCLKLTIPREGKRPLVATFGGLSLKRVKHPVIKDQVITPYPRMRSEIIERLLDSVSKVEIAAPMALTYKVFFPSISTFETPP